MSSYNLDFDGDLLNRDQQLRYKFERCVGTQKKMSSAYHRVNEAMRYLERVIESAGECLQALEDEVPRAIARDEKRFKKYLEEYKAKLLREHSREQAASLSEIEQIAVTQARTIAIFESILFAIENWATDDVPATDFTPVAQAVLFKAVYVPVMCGNTDYYMGVVPFSATEVVKRGREYVKALRSESQTPLTDTSMQLTAQQYQQWWINDALVLLYGDRDPEWEETKPHTLEEMELWKSTDMDKTMHFPKIFDAFELTRKYGDEIRESSGLPDFTKQIMQTRLTTYE